MNNARPFVLLGAKQLKVLSADIEAAAQRWSVAWLNAEAEIRVHSEGSSTSDWLCCRAQTGEEIFFARESNFIRDLLIGVYGYVVKSSALGDSPSPIVRDTLHAALLDLSAEILSGLAHIPMLNGLCIVQPPAQAEFQHGAGSLSVELKAGAIKLNLLIPGAIVAVALARAELPLSERDPLQPALGSLSKLRVRIRAKLGEAEVDIGTLQSLAVGDVIKLDAPINRPTQLLNDAQLPVCRGFLAARRGRKCLQLAK